LRVCDTGSGKKFPRIPYIIMYKNIANAVKARLYQYTIISRKRRKVKKNLKKSRGFGAIYKIEGIMLQ